MKRIIPFAAAALLSMNAAHAQGLYGFQQGWMQADQLRYHQRMQPQFWNAEPSPGIRPLPIIPPIGSRSCAPLVVCDAYGNNCGWQQNCY